MKTDGLLLIITSTAPVCLP